jgi:hypothetical protein
MSDKIYKGHCHCGKVRFEVLAPSKLIVWDCNCSICSMRKNAHFIVPSSNFTLLSDPSEQTVYSFNTHTAKHLFCKTCGITSYYIPRSNPNGIAVTLACIDSETAPSEVEVVAFDGKNWEVAFNSSIIQDIA